MLISWNKDEGFKLDVPYSKWLIFCIGLALLLPALAGLLEKIRWW